MSNDFAEFFVCFERPLLKKGCTETLHSEIKIRSKTREILFNYKVGTTAIKYLFFIFLYRSI